MDATDIVGGTRKLRSDELHNLSFSPYISRLTKLMRVRLTEHGAFVGVMDALWFMSRI